MKATTERKQNLLFFAKQFTNGHRVPVYIPEVSEETAKELCTLLAAASLILAKEINAATNWKENVSIFESILKAFEIVNFHFSIIDFLVIYRAITLISNGQQYTGDDTGVKKFIVRNNFENFVTVNVLPYE